MLAGLFASSAQAGSATWVATPADSNWSNGANWGGAAPGSTSSTTSADTASFTNALTNSFGTSANPIVVDLNRNISNITFDTQTASSYVIGTTGGPSLLLSNNGTIKNHTTGALTQTINAPLVFEGTIYNFQIQNSSLGASKTYIGGGMSGGNAGATTVNVGADNDSSTLFLTSAISNGASSGLGFTTTRGNVNFSSASNTFTGPITLNGGTVIVGNAAAFQDVANINCNAGTFNLNGFTPTFTGAVNFNMGGGTVTNTGAAASLSSGITIALSANKSGSFSTGSNALTINSPITGGSTGTIKFTGGSVTVAGVNTYSGPTVVSAGVVLVNSSLGASSNISVTGGLLKFGGSATLPGANSITISAPGALAPISTVQSLLNSGMIKTASTGIVYAASGTDPADFSSAGTGGNDYNGLFLGLSGGGTYTAAVTPGTGGYRFAGGMGSGTLTVNTQLTGANSLTLYGEYGVGNSANTYSGGTTILDVAGTVLNRSRLDLNARSSTGSPGSITQGPLGTGPVTIATNAQLFAGGFVTLANDLNLNGFGASTDTAAALRTDSGGTFSGLITLQSDASVGPHQASTSVVTFSGQITGNHTLTLGAVSINNAGQPFVFNNTGTPNDFGGLAIGAGAGVSTLRIGADEQIPDAIVPAFANTGSTIDLFGAHTETIGGLASAGVVDNTVASTTAHLILNVASDQTSATVIKNTGGALNLTKTGSATQTLSGVSTYSGTTTVSQGNLSITGALGDGTKGTSSVSVSGGTLSGTGTIAGGSTPASVLIQAGTLSPGTAAAPTGQLTITGPVTFTDNASKFAVNIAAAGSYSQLLIKGSVTLNGASLVLNDAGSTAPLGTQFWIVDGLSGASAGLVSSTFAYNGTPLSDGTHFTDSNNITYQINYNVASGDPNGSGSNAVLTVVAAPEPASVCLMGIGAVGLLARRRRRA